MKRSKEITNTIKESVVGARRATMSTVGASSPVYPRPLSFVAGFQPPLALPFCSISPPPLSYFIFFPAQ